MAFDLMIVVNSLEDFKDINRFTNIPLGTICYVDNYPKELKHTYTMYILKNNDFTNIDNWKELKEDPSITQEVNEYGNQKSRNMEM